MATRALDDRQSSQAALHRELVARAMAAQDAVFADASVDVVMLAESLKRLGDRLVAQLEALAAARE